MSYRILKTSGFFGVSRQAGQRVPSLFKVLYGIAGLTVAEQQVGFRGFGVDDKGEILDGLVVVFLGIFVVGDGFSLWLCFRVSWPDIFIDVDGLARFFCCM